ncbi:MAG: nitroreductase [Pseudomonadota bacterium]
MTASASTTLPPTRREEVLRFLAERRSVPAKTLAAPGPDRATVSEMLQLASRVPDHGKLAPWRFIVVEAEARERLGALAEARAERLGHDPLKARKSVTDGPVMVTVIAAPRPSEKIPAIEQVLSAGCVCLSLVNAALAMGWGANWLSGWLAYDRQFMEDALSLSEHESIVGFIHIGTAQIAPAERDRPNAEAITTFLG